MKLSYYQIDDLIRHIFQHIKEYSEYSDQTFAQLYHCVCGIERGGMFPAKRLSEMMNVPLISVKVSFYHEGLKTPSPFPIITDLSNLPTDLIHDHSKAILVVDDLLDSGRTIGYLKEIPYYKKQFATLLTTSPSSVALSLSLLELRALTKSLRLLWSLFCIFIDWIPGRHCSSSPGIFG